MPRQLIASLIVAASLMATSSRAEPATMAEEKHQTFGASFAPAALPPGAAAVYGYLGVPEVGAGYRQGTSLGELELKAKFNYLLISFGVDLIGKLPVYHDALWDVAPSLGFGVGYDSGSLYFDDRNFQAFLIHVEPGGMVTYRVQETLRVIGAINVPMDFGVSAQRGYRVVPLIGGGAEYYLGDDFTVGGLAQIGVDVMKATNAVTQTQVGYLVKLAVGYRLF